MTDSGELTWRKSSQSANNPTCAEVAWPPGGDVLVRHSLEPHGPVLRFTRAEWDSFLVGAKGGEFDDEDAG
ncbi:DUF397 domain-containing protein [Catenulispora pinisilvae]|uniref:DUF397 domain-containing protein n=1 Tax=Catenulispora pinisilvae TaxID=2705253 RepID=UPI001891C7EB|nr:DUF397 domain-containing protein [Catenulispora pinisilvae]